MAQRDGLNVVLFGATNAAAQRLNGLTGIAAILRYEMAELQDIIESDEEDEDSDLENEITAPKEEAKEKESDEESKDEQ